MTQRNPIASAEKKSNCTTSPFWLATLSPLTDQSGQKFLAQTQKIICIIHAGQLL